MTETEMTQVVVEVVKTLSPLSSEERRRVIGASLTILGDDPGSIKTKSGGSNSHDDDDEDHLGFPSRANIWIKQNSITSAELEQVFHIQDGAVRFISSQVPGSNDKDRTLNTYVLMGAAKLLESGEPNFDDTSAKDLCKLLGCLIPKNHARYVAAKGNEFTGSKEKGWTLTAPGLKKAASLIKELTKDSK